MAGQKIELGLTGRNVADNIKRIRVARAINYADLSRRLAELGRSISPLAVRKIEDGSRRVDVDDLMAFAVALEAPPNSLLFPHTDPRPGSSGTALDGVQFMAAWGWAEGDGPIRNDETVAEGVKTRELARPVLLQAPQEADGADVTARMLALMQEVTALSYDLRTRDDSGDD